MLVALLIVGIVQLALSLFLVSVALKGLPAAVGLSEQPVASARYPTSEHRVPPPPPPQMSMSKVKPRAFSDLELWEAEQRDGRP